LEKLAEASSGVGETPGRQFDAKGVQRFTEGIALAAGHQKLIETHTGY
jgi:hypothetical protein